MKIIGVTLLAIIVLVAAASIFGDDERTRSEKVCNGEDKIGAFVMSQTFVTRNLKAPSTAEYPWFSSDGVSVLFRGECKYTVAAFVDAQNSFGARIRSRYVVDLYNVRGTQEWVATKVEIR